MTRLGRARGGLRPPREPPLVESGAGVAKPRLPSANSLALLAPALQACMALAAASLLLATPAWAAGERPSESDMFGGGPPPGGPDAGAADAADATGVGGSGGAGASGGAGVSGATAAPAPAGATSPTVPVVASPVAATPASPPGPSSPASARDTDLLGDPSAGPRLSQDVAPEDPLKIGGQVYLRALAQSTQGQSPQDIRFSSPSLVDGYFDARPNDRVRGFVLGRLQFDSTLPSTSAASTGFGTSSGLAAPALSGAQNTRGPTTILDQLWLRFDILHSVFVTAGRQHVKWGTARFWTPTDFLHPQRRNPVAVFDARPGFTMLKLHLPWEERGWNFYAFGLVEGTRQLDRTTGRYPDGTDGSGTLGQLGSAARAEVVLGTAELGLDAVLYRGHKPKWGGDLSFGIGDFDLYVDAALRYGSELPRRGVNPTSVPIGLLTPLDQWVDQQYPLYYSVGVKPQVTVGGTYSLKYNDNDVFTITGEYFYNPAGYDDPRVYPGLFLTNTFEFFYTGRHYAALGAIAAAPWSWNYTTFTLTTLGNLSDQSFISRLDYSLVVLTHLRFEAFGAVNYGRTEGEFRLGVNRFMIPADPLAVDQTPRSFSLAPQAFSLGVGLRISI